MSALVPKFFRQNGDLEFRGSLPDLTVSAVTWHGSGTEQRESRRYCRDEGCELDDPSGTDLEPRSPSLQEQATVTSSTKPCGTDLEIRASRVSQIRASRVSQIRASRVNQIRASGGGASASALALALASALFLRYLIDNTALLQITHYKLEVTFCFAYILGWIDSG